uniref:MarR family winged helix-turn-helix transcriptional regulator n=1 Tax=Marinobacterium profundum TaxID=1714300 RepID=UPI0008353793|nr:MarR family transcriptional regulator [Marinobacterium profundum]
MSNKAEGDLVIGLANLQNKIQKRLGAALSAHGISVTEYMVLLQLHGAANNRMRRIDLAENVGLSASGVTRLLNPMVKIGLVHKEENARDARVSLVALSDAGAQLFQDAEVSFNHAAQTMLEPLDRQQQGALAGIIKALL